MARTKKSEKFVLAKKWEGNRRIRKRFERTGKWVKFPVPVGEKPDTHPVSTAALAMNADALHSIVEVYGPNPVHIEPLQKQAPGFNNALYKIN